MKSHVRVVAQPLPYGYDGLKSFGIDEDQLEEHYHNHHCGYAEALEAIVSKDSNLCSIIDAQDMAAKRLEMIYRQKVQKQVKSDKPRPSSSEFPSDAVKPSPLTSAEALMLQANKGSSAANLASMVANHDFFWRCWDGTTSPQTSTAEKCDVRSKISIGPETTSYSLPSGTRNPALIALLTQIESDFGSVRGMMDTFEKASLSLFASGWVWLAWSRAHGKLIVMTTRDSINPLTINSDGMPTKKDAKLVTHGEAVQQAQFVPLLGCDMWEHAYLVHGAPYQGPSATAKSASALQHTSSDKRRYLRKFWSAANWGFALDNFNELMRMGGTRPLIGSKKKEGGTAAQAKL